MTPQAIAEIADLLGVSCKGPDSSGWCTLGCPFAPFKHERAVDRNPSMRVSVGVGAPSRWKCFSCGEGGETFSVLTSLQLYGAELPFKELSEIAAAEDDELLFTQMSDEPTAPPIVVPETWFTEFPSTWATQAGGMYCEKRGISLEQQMHWGLRYDVEARRVLFPIRDFNGALRGVQGRTILPDVDSKYIYYKIKHSGVDKARGSEFWFGEQFVDIDLPVLLVEGPIDAVSAARVYPNVVAAMGAASVMTYEKLDRLAAAFSVVTMFDPNKAGQTARDKIEGWCKHKRLCKHLMCEPDEDPGSMNAAQLTLLISKVLDVT